MKNLLNICLLLWLGSWLGKDFFPAIFGVWYVQWPAVVCLAVLVPIGFAKSLSIYFELGTKSLKLLCYPIMFLFIFCLSLIIRLPVHYVSAALFAIKSGPIALNTDLLEDISKAESEQEREKSAQIIYYEYGKKVPYRLNSDKFKIYEPTEEDRSRKSKFDTMRNESEYYINYIIKSSKEIVYLQLAEIICFFLIFTITLILEQKSKYANQTLNQTGSGSGAIDAAGPDPAG